MKRNFCLGSEWLYYKIYTGVKTTDIILTEKLQPIIANLISEKLISKWFFIRYKDPQEHFRIRFLYKSSDKLGEVISRLYVVFEELLEQDVIWKVQVDTYQREIERYGEKTMEASESIFWHDSELVLQYLSIKELFEKKESQLLFSFLTIDTFLNDFAISNTQKLELLDDMQTAFKKEFAADKMLKKEMDKHYRDLSTEINDFLTGKSISDFSEIQAMVNKKSNQVKPVAQYIQSQLEIPLFSFINSHIHMMVNRQFTSKQRMYEALIYDHLYRYYKRIVHFQP